MICFGTLLMHANQKWDLSLHSLHRFKFYPSLRGLNVLNLRKAGNTAVRAQVVSFEASAWKTRFVRHLPLNVHGLNKSTYVTAAPPWNKYPMGCLSTKWTNTAMQSNYTPSHSCNSLEGRRQSNSCAKG